MKTFKKITLAFCISLFSSMGIAQQNPMFTHYMYNTLAVNPAYAGSREALTITGLHRSQWVDFKGAPETQTLTLHTPIFNDHIGLGFSAMNDRIGPINNTSLVFDFAYKLQLTEKSKLALGLSAGANILQANLSSLDLDQQNDPAFQNNVNNGLTPNVGLGAYYSTERFYTGLSTPNLLENKSVGIEDQRHYFLIAGALVHLGKSVDLKPTTLIKYTAGAPLQADVTGSFIFLDKFLVGAMVRTGDAVGALVGFNLNEQLHLGYSYDWSYGLETPQYNQGSHEIVLRYDFIYPSKRQIHTPRYF